LLFGNRERAFAAAAVWGLHPVLSESVTNIIGRSDLLSAFGVLAGLLCHIMASRRSGRRRARWLIGLLLAGTIAMFSKESGIVLLAVMGIYDLTFRESASWRARAPGYLVVLIPVCGFLYARSVVLAPLPGVRIGFGDNPLVAGGFWPARMTAIKV